MFKYIIIILLLLTNCGGSTYIGKITSTPIERYDAAINVTCMFIEGDLWNVTFITKKQRNCWCVTVPMIDDKTRVSVVSFLAVDSACESK